MELFGEEVANWLIGASVALVFSAVAFKAYKNSRTSKPTYHFFLNEGRIEKRVDQKITRFDRVSDFIDHLK